MYFGGNPHVAGMATEDNRVILNPFSANSAAEQEAVTRNEQARIKMRTDPTAKPKFDLSPEQLQKLAGYGSPDDMRQTIAARLLTNDPSAGTASPDQVAFVNQLMTLLGGR